MSGRLNSILEQLGTLPDLGSFAAIIEMIRSAYDVDHVYYYAISLGIDSHERADQAIETFQGDGGVLIQMGRKVAAVSYSPDWMARYLEARFYETDPVLHGASVSFDPVDWAELDWEGTGNRQFMEEAVDFGVGNQGYTIPVRGPGGQLAIFTVNKQCSADVWQRLLAESRTDFLLLAHFTHQRVLKLAGIDHVHQTRPLSNREREAVRLIANGLSRARASEALGISENTFRVYIDSARHKLGALNIPHAIALAAHKGIITPT